MDNDFFKKEEKEEKVEPQAQENQQPEKIKLGEKEYSQDELSRLVGLGETAEGYEKQWNRKIDQFYPDYTQKSQKLAEFEKKEAEREQAELKVKAEAGNLSPEEARRIAREEAIGLGIVVEDNLDERITQAIDKTLTAKTWVDRANDVIADAQEKGQPKTTVEDLISFAKNKGFNLNVSPEDIYKLRFEPEIDQWKEAQLGKIKQPGLDTQTGSQAGSKEPEKPEPITSRDALSQAVAARLRQGAGQ